MAIFFLQNFVIFNMIANSFLVEKWRTSEYARRYVCRHLDCQDSICFTFFKLTKNEGSFGKGFSFVCSAKCFERNFKYFLLYFKYCTLPFPNIMKFVDLKHIIFSINFFNNN